MVFLWTSLALAVVAGLTKPFAERVQATGLWAGKALVPEAAKDSYPRGLQDALTDGWPSTLGIVGGTLPFVAGVVGFFYTWWVGILAFVAALFAAAIAQRTQLCSPYVERYLTILVNHLNNRRADYSKNGDKEREEAAAGLLVQLGELHALYLGSGVLAPTMTVARTAPYGNPHFLLDLAERGGRPEP